MPGGYLAWIEGGAALGVLLAVSWILFRHLGFALLSVLSPLLPSLAAPSAFPANYLCGFLIAVVLIASVETLRSQSTVFVLERIWRDLGPVAIWGSIAATGIGTVAPLVAGHIHGLSGSVLMLASGISAAVLVLSIAGFLPFAEHSVADTNRLREMRERWLDRLAFVVQPRWGWSVSGIALVFAVMGYFGGSNAKGEWLATVYWLVPGWTVVVLLIGYLASRDIRRTIAFLFTGAMLVCLSYWAAARLHPAVRDWNDAIALTIVPVTIMLASTASFVRGGDNVAVANLRAMEQCAFALVVALIAAFLVCALFAKWITVCLLPFSGAAAVIVLPALTTAIYDLLPPRVSLDAYKLR